MASCGLGLSRKEMDTAFKEPVWACSDFPTGFLDLMVLVKAHHCQQLDKYLWCFLPSEELLVVLAKLSREDTFAQLLGLMIWTCCLHLSQFFVLSSDRWSSPKFFLDTLLPYVELQLPQHPPPS